MTSAECDLDNALAIAGAYAAACMRCKINEERAEAAKLRAAIQAYGDERVKLALETAAEGRNDFFWQTGPEVYR